MPWSVSAGEGSTWTLTDWFENLYIGTSGPWKYDALFAGKLPFDDPPVIAALRLMTNLLTDENVSGGIDGALATDLGHSIRAVFGPKRRAHLYVEGGFVGPIALQLIKPTPRPGNTIAAAPFPRIDASLGSQCRCRCGLRDPVRGRRGCTRVTPLSQFAGSGANLGVVGRHRFTAQGRTSERLPQRPRPHGGTSDNAGEGRSLGRFGSSSRILGADLGTALQRVLEHPDQASQLMQALQRKAAKVFKQ